MNKKIIKKESKKELKNNSRKKIITTKVKDKPKQNKTITIR